MRGPNALGPLFAGGDTPPRTSLSSTPFAIPLDGKHDALIDRIRHLPDGLSEWAVHPAQAAAMDGDANVRRSDYELLMADDTRNVLAEEGIVVLGYGDTELRAPEAR